MEGVIFWKTFADCSIARLMYSQMVIIIVIWNDMSLLEVSKFLDNVPNSYRYFLDDVIKNNQINNTVCSGSIT